MSNDGQVTLNISNLIAHITFDRPRARNAMTWRMYEDMAKACETIRSRDDIRVAILRGAGGKAFIAGTDIAQFADFSSGEDGINYEKQIAEFVGGVASLPIPTVAVVEGWDGVWAVRSEDRGATWRIIESLDGFFGDLWIPRDGSETLYLADSGGEPLSVTVMVSAYEASAS